MAVSDETLQKYEMTIGIECHVQLATDTKLFSPANNDARDAEPNTRVHPIDFGLPGMLPINTVTLPITRPTTCLA
jgi:aspartyl-tRNA(Asn)/glutamyl-tRNA(Gln) amidotransferase subunit B